MSWKSEQQMEREKLRAQNKALKKFTKIVMSKDLVSFEKDNDGYVVCVYKNGSIFKCRGTVVEMAGLL